MNKIALLVLFMLFAFCGTSTADVITTWDGSVFEGERSGNKEHPTVFIVAEGIISLPDEAIVSIEDREPTEEERARLLRFSTERYDVDVESTVMDGWITPFEERVVDAFDALADKNPDMSNREIIRRVAKEFNLPPIIVYIIGAKVYVILSE